MKEKLVPSGNFQELSEEDDDNEIEVENHNMDFNVDLTVADYYDKSFIDLQRIAMGINKKFEIGNFDIHNLPIDESQFATTLSRLNKVNSFYFWKFFAIMGCFSIGGTIFCVCGGLILIFPPVVFLMLFTIWYFVERVRVNRVIKKRMKKILVEENTGYYEFRNLRLKLVVRGPNSSFVSVKFVKIE